MNVKLATSLQSVSIIATQPVLTRTVLPGPQALYRRISLATRCTHVPVLHNHMPTQKSEPFSGCCCWWYSTNKMYETLLVDPHQIHSNDIYVLYLKSGERTAVQNNLHMGRLNRNRKKWLDRGGSDATCTCDQPRWSELRRRALHCLCLKQSIKSRTFKHARA